MVILSFFIARLLLIFMIPQNGIGNQEESEPDNIKDYNKKQHEAETYFATPIRSIDNLQGYSGNKPKEKDGLSRKREAIVPSIVKDSLGTGLLLPTGINAQLVPGVNLRLDQSIIPTLKEQSTAVLETANTIKYPVNVLVLDSKDLDEKLKDYKIEKIPITLLNSNINKIIDTSKPNELEISHNLNTIGTKLYNNTVSDLTNKSKIVPQNVIKDSLNNSNKSDKTDVSLTIHEDDNFLTNHTNEQINELHEVSPLFDSNNIDNNNNTPSSIADLKPVKEPNNSEKTNKVISDKSSKYDENPNSKVTENEDYLYKDKTEAKETTRHYNYEHESNNEQSKQIDIQNVTPTNFRQSTNNVQYDIKYQPDNWRTDNNENNLGLKYNNKDVNVLSHYKPDYEYSIKDRYHQTTNTPSYNNIVSNTNILKQVSNENNNNYVGEYENIRPEFKYPFHDQNTKVYQNHEFNSIVENRQGYSNKNELIPMQDVRSARINSVEDYYKYGKAHQYQQPETIPVLVYNGNRNTDEQKLANVGSVFKYPIKYPNSNVNYYDNSKFRVENHGLDGTGDDVRLDIYNKRNNDPSIMYRNLKLYYTNSPSYVNKNSNCENTANPKRIQCLCNQQRPLINCNGFYSNQNIPVVFPPYLYYPYFYNVYS